MPDVVVVDGNGDPRNLFGAVLVEQAQFHFGRMGGKSSRIDAPAVIVRAQRISVPGCILKLLIVSPPGSFIYYLTGLMTTVDNAGSVSFIE